LNTVGGRRSGGRKEQRQEGLRTFFVTKTETVLGLKSKSLI